MRRIIQVAGWLLLLTAYPPNRLSAQDIILATTTSLRDTGLLDSLLPSFQRAGWRVKVVAVGSGQALELARRGDADVVVSHAPAAEQVLVDSGYFVSRRRLMHNDFVVVGPENDPANISGQRDVVGALRAIANERAPFVSRGDRSGTHIMELSLWQRVRVTPPGPGAWYAEAGQGMAATLALASERRAYALSDRATFLAWRNRLQLDLLVEGDSLLLNVYSVLVTNPRNAPRVNRSGAEAFATWLLSPQVQQRIGEFGKARFGQSLFVPDARTGGP